LFAHEEGVKAITHRGKMLIQSQHDDTVINAERDVTVTASQGKVTCMAEKEVVWINSAGSYVKLVGEQIEIGCPGSYTVKAATRHLLGPASMSPKLPTFKEGCINNQTWIELKRLDSEQQPISGSRYTITFDSGEVIKGVLDKNGFARHENTPLGSAKVLYEDETEDLQRLPMSGLAQLFESDQ
jgi:uncharacterized protein (DUF2345 family)